MVICRPHPDPLLLKEREPVGSGLPTRPPLLKKERPTSSSLLTATLALLLLLLAAAPQARAIVPADTEPVTLAGIASIAVDGSLARGAQSTRNADAPALVQRRARKIGVVLVIAGAALLGLRRGATRRFRWPHRALDPKPHPPETAAADKTAPLSQSALCPLGSTDHQHCPLVL